jgi:hypothetical protein
MDRRDLVRASRWAVTALALIVAVALVVGIQPRTLAQEVGVGPLESTACFLCDGATTAATIAPASGSVHSASIAPLAFVILLLVPGLVIQHPLAGRAAAPPLPPPPRS